MKSLVRTFAAEIEKYITKAVVDQEEPSSNCGAYSGLPVPHTQKCRSRFEAMFGKEQHVQVPQQQATDVCAV